MTILRTGPAHTFGWSKIDGRQAWEDPKGNEHPMSISIAMVQKKVKVGKRVLCINEPLVVEYERNGVRGFRLATKV